MKCVICGNKIIGKGNNSAPVKVGKCCDFCNLIVIKKRIKMPNNK